MLAGERTFCPAEGEHSQASRFRDKDCKRTALWRHPFQAEAEGAKRIRANLSGKRTEQRSF